MINKHKFRLNKISINMLYFGTIVTRYNLFFLVCLLGGSLILAAGAHAKTIGPQPIAFTNVAKGTLFVRPNGNGNVCSKANPCNIWTAIDKASAGDVVFLRGGTYAVSKNITIKNRGTASNPIIFESFPGETAVFNGGQHAKGTKVFFRITGKFIHIRGVEIKNMPRYGLYISGTDNLIDGVHTHHNAINGIMVFSPYSKFPYGAFGSRNIIRNSISHDNSDVGSFPGSANGGNADGIMIASGTKNRVENCLTYRNSDDGIDAWRSTNTYIGYNISHSNGIGNPGRDGNGIKAGGASPSTDTFVEHNLLYSNKAFGITYNRGANATFSKNTTRNNKDGGFRIGSDTIVTRNIAKESIKNKGDNGIASNNSWQRSGNVTFISTDPASRNFLRPKRGGGFEDIGAFVNVSNTSAANNSSTSLSDVIVTQVSYANGIFTSTVKNIGGKTTPAGVVIGVGYSVNGKYKTWGGKQGPLAPGASATIGTDGAPYVIPESTYSITAWVDDVNRFKESNENNNKLTKSGSGSGGGGGGSNTTGSGSGGGGSNTTSLPDVVVTDVSYANGLFTSTVKNKGGAATPDVFITVSYLVNGQFKTWGGKQGPLAPGKSFTIGSQGGSNTIPKGTHTITAHVDNVKRFKESNENNNQLSRRITVP